MLGWHQHWSNFSVPCNAAVALLDGELTPRQVARERIGDARVWELAQKVRLRHDPDWTRRIQQSSVIALAGGSPEFDLADADLTHFERVFGATVTLTLEGGRRLERAQAVALDAAGRPLAESAALVEAKFAREAAHAISAEDATRAAMIVGDPEEASAAEIRELLARRTGKA